MSRLALSIAIAVACYTFSAAAKPASHSRSLSGRNSLAARDDTPAYAPIPPSALADVEYRPSSSSPSTGDYIASGLSAEMDMVAQQYGLRDSESFYWGLDGMPLANLTAFAEGEDVRVLSVERFDGVVEAAECSTSSVKLTFTQEVQFQDVLSAWSWINEAEENYVVLVTESSQCNIADGDESIRQPWHVNHATFDDAANTVLLDAEPKTWNDAFGTWHLVVDSRGLLPSQTLQPRKTASADTSISLAHDWSGLAFPLPNDGNATCTQCSTYGELHFVVTLDAGVKSKFVVVPEPYLKGSFEVHPVSVGTSLDVDVDLKPSAEPSPVSFDMLQLGRAVYIAGFIEITPQLSFGIGATTQLGEEVIISTGITANIPDSANAGIYFDSSANDLADSSAFGWTPVLTPHETLFSNNVDVSGTIGPQVKLELKIGVTGFSDITDFGAGIGLVLTVPQLIINATVFEKDQASSYGCEAPADDEGIFLQLDVGLEFDAFEEYNFLLAKDSATQPIYTTSAPFTSTCLGSTAAIAIPTGTIPANGGQGPVGSTYPLPGTNSTSPAYAPYGSAPCATHGELVCNGQNYFALCNWGTAIWQPVSEGTACEDGRIVGTGVYAVPPVYPSGSGSGSCSVNGQLLCNGGDQFGLCNWGRVVWQPVAAGTQCQSGQIVRRGVYASPTPTPMVGYRHD